MNEFDKDSQLNLGKEYLSKANSLHLHEWQAEIYQWATKAARIFRDLKEWEHYVAARNRIGAVRLLTKDAAELKETETYLKDTLDIALNKLEEQNYQVLTAYSNMGNWYIKVLRTPTKAKPYFEKMLERVIEIHGEVSMEAVNLYNNIGRIYQIEQDHKTAMMYAEKIVDLIEQLNQIEGRKPSIFVQITAKVNLASTYIDFKETEKKSKYYFEKALQECNDHEFKEKPETLARLYRQYAALYLQQKRHDQALAYFKRAIEEESRYLPPQHPSIAQTYHQAALLYLQAERPTEALPFLQKSLEINRQFFELPSIAISANFQGMGMCLYKQKKFKEALPYFQKALNALLVDFQYESMYDNPKLSQSLDNRLFLFILGMKSIIFFRQYLVEQQTTRYLEAALKTFFLYVELMDFIRNHYETQHTILAFLASTEVNAVFDFAPQAAVAAKQLEDAHFFCEKAKAIVLTTSMRESMAKIAASIPQILLAREKELKTELTFLEKQIVQEEAKGKEQRENILLQWKSQFFDLHQEYLQLIQQFEQDYPDYYQLKYETQTVSIESLQQNLTDNQIMVNYFVGENHYYLFLISSNGFEVHDFEKPEDFEALVEGFLEAVHEHQLEEYAAKAYELYQYLLQPVEHHLMDSFALFGDLEEAENEDTLEEAKPKELIIIPHGILSYLPFEALLCSALEDSMEGELREGENAYHHLDYLLLHCEVSYHYSATLWHYLSNVRGERAEAEHDFVGFAPVYQSEAGREIACPKVSGSEQRDKNEKVVIEEAWKIAAKEVGQWATRSDALRSDGTWTPLPHSKVEAEQIAHLFEQKGLKTQTFLHEQATKEQFQEVVENSRFLLIAAHGVVNDAQPKLSGLVFYPEMREKRIETKEKWKMSPSFVKHGDIWNDTRKMSPNLTGVGESSQTDCILSMEETYHLDLKADLVVLSSCESGIGELAKGEGMMAVNRGFLYAGAKNVVSTLFKVYDKPSSLLTQYLFEGVLEGKSYTAALREAKLRLLKQEEVDVKSWSGFVLIG